MPRFDKLEFDDQGRRADPQEPAPGSDRARPDWIARADLQRRQGHYETALKFYSRGLEDDKTVVHGWISQVQMLVLLDELPEAELWARKALELFPSHGDLMAGRAQAFWRMGNRKAAQELSDGALAQARQSAYPWMVRGEIVLDQREEVDSHCFDQAQQIDPDWLVPLEIALAYLYHRKPGKALPRAQRAVELAADQCYAFYVRGLCQMRLGLTRPARESFGHCMELCPGHADADRCLRDLSDSPFSWRRLVSRLFRR